MIWPMSVCNVLGAADVKAKINTCASLEGALESAYRSTLVCISSILKAYVTYRLTISIPITHAV